MQDIIKRLTQRGTYDFKDLLNMMASKFTVSKGRGGIDEGRGGLLRGEEGLMKHEMQIN